MIIYFTGSAPIAELFLAPAQHDIAPALLLYQLITPWTNLDPSLLQLFPLCLFFLPFHFLGFLIFLTCLVWVCISVAWQTYVLEAPWAVEVKRVHFRLPGSRMEGLVTQCVLRFKRSLKRFVHKSAVWGGTETQALFLHHCPSK